MKVTDILIGFLLGYATIGEGASLRNFDEPQEQRDLMNKVDLKAPTINIPPIKPDIVALRLCPEDWFKVEEHKNCVCRAGEELHVIFNGLLANCQEKPDCPRRPIFFNKFRWCDCPEGTTRMRDYRVSNTERHYCRELTCPDNRQVFHVADPFYIGCTCPEGQMKTNAPNNSYRCEWELF